MIHTAKCIIQESTQWRIRRSSHHVVVVLIIEKLMGLTNKWIPNKARELLDTVEARKLAYYGHTMRKQESCLKKEIMEKVRPW